MSFNLVLATQIPDPDNEGEFIDSTSTIACRAELSGNGTLNVYHVNEDATETHVVTQPWKFSDTGVRQAWENLEEGIAWYLAQSMHTGE